SRHLPRTDGRASQVGAANGRDTHSQRLDWLLPSDPRTLGPVLRVHHDAVHLAALVLQSPTATWPAPPNDRPAPVCAARTIVSLSNPQSVTDKARGIVRPHGRRAGRQSGGVRGRLGKKSPRRRP